jgi:hypothetical protein
MTYFSNDEKYPIPEKEPLRIEFMSLGRKISTWIPVPNRREESKRFYYG